MIWLTDYPTQEFADNQKVRVVGPVKAGPTKNYTAVSGGSNTVRSFSLVKGKQLEEYEKLQAEENIRAEAREIALSLIWGKSQRTDPKMMNAQQLRVYKNLSGRVEKQFESGKVNPRLSAKIEVDSKGKVEFVSEQVKELAILEVKSISSIAKK